MKITYEVLIVILSAGLTMKLTSHLTQQEAEKEARRQHSKDQQPYKVIKVTKECIFTIK